MTTTTVPRRIQRKRTKGWAAPLDVLGRRPVYVGRGTRWGNPWAVAQTRRGWAVNWTKPGKAQPDWTVSTDNRAAAHVMAVGLYREYLDLHPELVECARRELAGRDLMCWCPLPAPGEPDHCHAAVLLALANGAGGA